jgi:hypothetical protein
VKAYVGETYITNRGSEVAIFASYNSNVVYRFEGSDSRMYSEDGESEDHTKLLCFARKNGITEVKTIGGRSVAICSLEQFRNPSKITKATLVENIKDKMFILIENLKCKL